MKENALFATVSTSCYKEAEVHLLLCLWLRNSTKHNRVESSTYVNHDNDENRAQELLILRQKYKHFAHIGLFMAKTIRFSYMIQRLLNLSFIITVGKKSTAKDLSKPKIHKLL